MSWNEGYHIEITYAYGYFTDMNPTVPRFLMLMAAIKLTEVSSACEPGYGQGPSLNIHAAAGMAAYAADCLNSVAQKIIKDGQPIEEPSETIAYPHRMPDQFDDDRLPLLKKLLIA